jgi:glyoxylate/hydroxypyruvate reductase A
VTIVVNPWGPVEEWIAELSKLLPDETFVAWPDCPEPADVDLVVAWKMRRADLATFTSLKGILSMGAGAEQWQKDGTPDVPIVRLADPTMSDEMASYSVHWVTRFHRGFDVAQAQQGKSAWDKITAVSASEFRVGILGYGTIGSRIGRAFSDLGYGVNAWSRSGTNDSNVSSFTGPDQLAKFLGSSNAVINVLPSTDATTGLLDPTRLAQFRDGSVLINIGRGTVLSSESDLLHAIDDGPLRAAVLDVTNPEPPASDSPLFSHPGVHLTPHIAAITQMSSSVGLIAANITRIRKGESPYPVVDPSTGY